MTFEAEARRRLGALAHHLDNAADAAALFAALGGADGALGLPHMTIEHVPKSVRGAARHAFLARMQGTGAAAGRAALHVSDGLLRGNVC